MITICPLRSGFSGRPDCEQAWYGDWSARPKYGPDNCCLARRGVPQNTLWRQAGASLGGDGDAKLSSSAGADELRNMTPDPPQRHEPGAPQ